MPKKTTPKEKPNVIMRFRDFYTKLDREEKAQLYIALSMLRGPDFSYDEQCNETGYNVKMLATGRIRWILGFRERDRLGVDLRAKPLIADEKEYLRTYHTPQTGDKWNHYANHTDRAINTLKGLGFRV